VTISNPSSALDAARRRSPFHILAAAIAFAVAVAAAPPAFADRDDQRWVGTWSTAPLTRTTGVAIAGQTLREIVRVSVGGSQARVRLSNSFGTAPLVIGSAHLALRASGSAIVPGSDRLLTFGGETSITIVPGAHVLSDPVPLKIAALSDLAISLYLPGPITPSTTTPVTGHSTALQTSYISTPGDFTAALDVPVSSTILYSLFVMGVDVRASNGTTAVVTLGDSITDGTRSTPDTNSRWPNELARRLNAQRGRKMGVLNMGISGNRVISDGAGVSAQARFDRDVLAQTAVTHLVVLEGINDSSNAIFRADQIIAGLNQIAERAHEKGIKVFGATLTPAGSTGIREANRQAVNKWIREGGAFDAVIDFDKVTLDPTNPTFFLPAYDSGDHLHPNDVGYKAMADSIDLRLFDDRDGDD
jgi:lysophospholipase L1-like esterase